MVSNSSLGEAVLDLRADDRPLERDINNAQQKASGLVGRIANVIQTGLGTALGIGIAGLVHKVTELGSSILGTGIQFNAMQQSSQVAFNTIIGDVGKAKTLMSDLQRFAAATPFEFPELAQASKNLLAFGVGAGEVVDTLRRIGDVASGVGAPLNDIAELYGKAKVQGRLFTNDIYQFQGRGIPILGELAKILGVSEARVSEMVTEGKVGFPLLEKAFVNLTSKGGKFNGMMAAQSKTFNGLLSTAKDTFAQISGKVMEPFFDLLMDGLQFIVDLTSTPEFTKWIDDLAVGVRSFVNSQFVPFLKDAWGVLSTQVVPALQGVVELVRMVSTGDFRGGIFGLNEDDPWIMALLDGRRALMGILEWVQRVFEYASKGNWEAVWAVIGNGLKNAWTQTIQPTLQEWGTKFWDWLTGPGGALEQGETKLLELVNGIGVWLQANGPATWEQLKTWADEFWNWLTGPGGALEQLNVEMGKLTQGLVDWANSEPAQSGAREVGKALGEALFKDISGDGTVDPLDIVKVIDQFLLPIDTAIRNIGKAGDALAMEFWKSFWAVVKPNIAKWVDENITPLRDAILRALNPVNSMFPTLGLPGAGQGVMPINFGQNAIPNMIPKIGGFGVGGGIGTPILKVNIDGTEIKNAVLEVTYGDVQSLFAEATAAAGAP